VSGVASAAASQASRAIGRSGKHEGNTIRHRDCDPDCNPDPDHNPDLDHNPDQPNLDGRPLRHILVPNQTVRDSAKTKRLRRSRKASARVLSAQQSLPFGPGRGGARRQAGRKPKEGERPRLRHSARPPHGRANPVHVTLRRAPGLPSFRSQSVVIAFEERLRAASRGGFRVTQYSIQSDHIHLVVEAADRLGLSRGVQGLAIRLARGLNRELRRRGKVWGDRYHARELASPRAVRHALVYVLLNHKKHIGVEPGTPMGTAPRASNGARARSTGARARMDVRARTDARARRDARAETGSRAGIVGPLDSFSSAAWFDGWNARASPWFVRLRARLPSANIPVAKPRTWLARIGWRRLGLVDPGEAPR
jgi:hypothetical protein